MNKRILCFFIQKQDSRNINMNKRATNNNTVFNEKAIFGSMHLKSSECPQIAITSIKNQNSIIKIQSKNERSKEK